MKYFSIVSFAFLLSAGAVQAQTCEANFRTEGTPLLTALNYKSSVVLPGVAPARALDGIVRAVAAEGFSNVRVEKSIGTLTAMQETTGSGRPQTLRVVVRKSGKGSRVDAVFMVQAGQIASEGLTRAAICRVVGAASG